MLYENDIAENINPDLNDIFTIEELKYLLLLNADDQVPFAEDPQILQNMLNDVQIYCEK